MHPCPDGRPARDVVPQALPARGFLRRRRSDEPYPHERAPAAPAAEPPLEPLEPALSWEAVAPVAVAASAVEERAAVAPPAAVAQPGVPAPLDDADLWLLHDLPVAPPCTHCEQRAESEELARAQAGLLTAALRQADELATALAAAEERHEREATRLRGDNTLLRDALAVLQAEALARQAVVPDQRVAWPSGGSSEPRRPGRRRSDRPPGPA